MNALVPPPAIRTACPYCGVGCGVLAGPDGLGGAAISGDPAHPANFGKLCSKGAALGETLGLETRLLHPMLRRNGALARTDWDTALTQVADGFARIVERDGPDAVAFYLSGQLLTEDYYVANKLMKGFLGSANVDTNSRLCMASSVAGHRRAFGSDTVPGLYEDLDQADLIVLVGSNAAWCHPVLFRRMQENRRARGAKLVVIDPRRTATAQEADLFLPVASGMDTALFAGLLTHLADSDTLARNYIASHTSGFASSLERSREIAPDLAAVERSTGLLAADVAHFYELFAATPRVVTAYSQGVNQSAQGTDKVGAIINCHLATGRIGRPGMGPFSLTGQPNAMGGREVGGLANQLAAHMNFTPAEIDRVRRFWHAPNIATHEGLKAVDMFDAIESGKIKALWVMATNPAVSLPRAGAVRDALSKLELFVVSENVASNDTLNSGAHILLPAAAWGEKDGTVTNSERRISRQRAFLPLPGDARPDWWMVSQVAKKLGFGNSFSYESAADIFREHAALSAFENNGTRDFDIGALAKIGDAFFEQLDPVVWPAREGENVSDQRFFAEGGFFTADRKARFIAPEFPELAANASNDFPFVLNTGRVRDQWHTMTRTGLSPRLALHAPEPFVDIHPDDARACGLKDFARVTTQHGSGIYKVALNEGQQHGTLFAPIHWSGETASAARTCELVAPATDPYSGQPEAKATPAAITPVDYAWRGFMLTRRPVAIPTETWWARVALTGGTGTLLASNQEPKLWREHARTLMNSAELAEFIDIRRDVYRAASFRDGRLDGALFVGPAAAAPQWDAVKALFESEDLAGMQRRMLLSGRAADGLMEIGPVICACFGVGLNVIREAIASKSATNVEAIGKALRAGTSCGSCLPELKRIVHEHAHAV
ncbi:MAG: assimilatory nitrate reductase catalytic subunit [Hyphomicrobiales bacterium]|jgi:assimilatory nitrate reductase catalytic subunit|nr:assimilatory nitrate reductase catalytic subunit [Hyphomicrobiales bacterium]